MRKRLRRLTIGGAILAGLALATANAEMQTNEKPERFTAFAVNMSGTGRTSSGTLQIAIDRWSTQAEHDRLQAVFLEKGPDKLLDALQDTKRVGYIRTPQSLGYDLRYASQRPEQEGGRVIYILTDRRIGFAEARNQPRTIDYPFTFIEMHLDKNGDGEGKASVATKITLNKKTNQVELENYGTQPVLLTKIQTEK